MVPRRCRIGVARVATRGLAPPGRTDTTRADARIGEVHARRSSSRRHETSSKMSDPTAENRRWIRQMPSEPGSDRARTTATISLIKQTGGGLGVDGTLRSPDVPGEERSFPRGGRRDVPSLERMPTSTKARNPFARQSPRPARPARLAVPSRTLPNRGTDPREWEADRMERPDRASRTPSARRTGADRSER